MGSGEPDRERRGPRGRQARGAGLDRGLDDGEHLGQEQHLVAGQHGTRCVGESAQVTVEAVVRGGHGHRAGTRAGPEAQGRHLGTQPVAVGAHPPGPHDVEPSEAVGTLE